MNLAETYLLLFVLLVVIIVASVFFKNRIAMITPVMFVACAVATLVAGMGIRLREIVEGPFAFLDSSMWILCGASFCFLLYQNGTFQYIFQKIVAKKRGAVGQLALLVLFIAIPGMLTGTAMVSIATTGLMVGKYLLDKGIEKSKVVELVAVSSLFGVVLPPLCMPAMLPTIGYAGLYPGSFEGYALPCLIAALPGLIVYCIMSGKRILGELEADTEMERTGGPVCLVPLILVALLVFSHNFLYFVMPFIGYPLIYTIGFILAIFLKANRANPLEAAAAGIRVAAPEVALMCAFGAAVETMMIVGINGTISAQLSILGMNGVVFVLVGLVLILILGTAFGPCTAFVLAGCVNYVTCELLYGSSEMTMFAVGVVMCVTMITVLRGGVADMTSETLDVTGVSGKSVLKRAAVPVALVVLVAVIYCVARTACVSLMI